MLLKFVDCNLQQQAFSWPTLTGRYAVLAVVGPSVRPSVVRPVVISQKLSKIDP